MATNVSIQYNGGFLPDTILLTQCYYHRGTRLNAMKRFCICSLRSHQNVLTFPPDFYTIYTGGCSECLDAFKKILNTCHVANSPEEIRARAVME